MPRKNICKLKTGLILLSRKIKNINKYFIHILIIYQVIAIAASTINLIYDFITNKTHILFISYVSWFIPQYYLSKTGNLWNFLPLILLIGITIFLFLKSAKCLLSENTKQLKYPLLNVLWLGISQLSYMLFFCFNITGTYPPYFSISNLYSNIAFFFIYMIFIIVKFDWSKIFKENLDVKSYEHIRKYAFANALTAIFVAILNLWMHYFSDTELSNPNNHSMIEMDILFLAFILINTAIFIITLIYYHDVKNSGNNIVPCKHFLLKLNVIQIASFLIEIVVILLNAFVFFN